MNEPSRLSTWRLALGAPGNTGGLEKAKVISVQWKSGGIISRVDDGRPVVLYGCGWVDRFEIPECRHFLTPAPI